MIVQRFFFIIIVIIIFLFFLVQVNHKHSIHKCMKNRPASKCVTLLYFRQTAILRLTRSTRRNAFYRYFPDNVQNR